MTITPYQITPCYMKSIESPQWQLLKVGATVPIKPGDICALIPHKCWFKVESVVSSKMENIEKHPLKRKADTDVDSVKKLCLESGEGDNVRSPSNFFVNMSNNNDTTNIEENVAKDSHSENAIELSTPEENNSRVENVGETNISVPENLNLPSVSQENESAATEDKPSNTKRAHELENEDGTTGTVPMRERCKYGEKCYRKNPEHKAEFSHIGDADYDASDDKEVCRYGTRCYRKNPQHRAQFRHPFTNNGSNRKRLCTRAFLDSMYDLEDSMDESGDDSDFDPILHLDEDDFDEDDFVHIDDYNYPYPFGNLSDEDLDNLDDDSDDDFDVDSDDDSDDDFDVDSDDDPDDNSDDNSDDEHEG